MINQANSELETSILQIVILVFAGFATMAYQIYDSDAKEMASDGAEILAWTFMSYSLVFVYPVFLLTLHMLSRGRSLLGSLLLFLLWVFITVPITVLSGTNLWIAWKNRGEISWPLELRLINIVSSIIILAIIVVATLLVISQIDLSSISELYRFVVDSYN